MLVRRQYRRSSVGVHQIQCDRRRRTHTVFAFFFFFFYIPHTQRVIPVGTQLRLFQPLATGRPCSLPLLRREITSNPLDEHNGSSAVRSETILYYSVSI